MRRQHPDDDGKLLDLMLPDGNSPEILRHITKKSPETGVRMEGRRQK